MSCVLEAWKVKAFYIGMLCKIVSKLVKCSMVFQLCKQHGSIETKRKIVPKPKKGIPIGKRCVLIYDTASSHD